MSFVSMRILAGMVFNEVGLLLSSERIASEIDFILISEKENFLFPLPSL